MIRLLTLCTWAAFLASPVLTQDLPPSGSSGTLLVYATSPDGSSVLFRVGDGPGGPVATNVAGPVAAVPSRWAHRRRTLGALETEVTYLDGLLITPMGDAPGTGALHVVDTRFGSLASQLVPTGHPASYDLVVSKQLSYVLVAEDDGAGGTIIRGFSYAAAGTLQPLTPPVLTLSGSPCAHVTEAGVGAAGLRVHVPTTIGISIVDLSPTVPHMSVGTVVSTLPAIPTTTPGSFDRNGSETWLVGTSVFDPTGVPTEAGFLAWSADGLTVEADKWGTIPGLSPTRSFVPGAGTTELAIVGDGVDTWAYYLLRDPSPTASFIRPSAIGVVRFLGSTPAAVSRIDCPTECGEPFAIPTVHGTRIAIESSQGPPFSFQPPGGGEPISILYTPLDPLGSGTPDGLLATPAPLGGRISTKGMDRPVWTRDGSRVVAATSHFPGAPNPGMPGVEVLNVPASPALTFFNPPHYVVFNPVTPHRSIVFPSSWEPRDVTAASWLDGFSFVGNVFHNGMASVMTMPFGEIGQFQVRTAPWTQSPDIPNFPAVHPPAFLDATASSVPVPAPFGARRTTWNLVPGLGFMGLVMAAAVDDAVYVQPSGLNFLSAVGVLALPDLPPLRVPLPAGWITTSEILSL